MWGGLAALYSRSARQTDQGDWAVTSLATCASLTQLTLQKNEPPASAVGCYATGMPAHNRVYRVADANAGGGPTAMKRGRAPIAGCCCHDVPSKRRSVGHKTSVGPN